MVCSDKQHFMGNAIEYQDCAEGADDDATLASSPTEVKAIVTTKHWKFVSICWHNHLIKFNLYHSQFICPAEVDASAYFQVVQSYSMSLGIYLSHFPFVDSDVRFDQIKVDVWALGC